MRFATPGKKPGERSGREGRPSPIGPDRRRMASPAGPHVVGDGPVTLPPATVQSHRLFLQPTGPRGKAAAHPGPGLGPSGRLIRQGRRHPGRPPLRASAARMGVAMGPADRSRPDAHPKVVSP